MTYKLQFPVILNFVDFRHDLANQASLLALAAPKVQFSIFNLAKPHFTPV